MSTSYTPYGGKGPALVAIGTPLCGTATILLLLRAYAASRINGRWRWDFIWAVLAGVFSLASYIAATFAILSGLGNHIKDLSYPDIFQSLHRVWVALYISLPAAVFAKFSIIALLLTIQGPNARKKSYVLYGIGALIAASAMVQLFLSLFQCEPIAKLWEPTLDGSCPRLKPAGSFSYYQGAVVVAADVILALWPITIVWDLQTATRVKVGFCTLMAIGILPTIGAILRMKMLPYIAHSDDLTYDFYQFMAWGTVELWSVIILGSIPPLRPLFLRVVYGIKSKGASYGTSHGPATLAGGAGTMASRPGDKSTIQLNVMEKAKTTGKNFSKAGMSGRGSDEEGLITPDNHDIL
ncbi:hypothetical protein C1H76_5203 [Elsinoe australis]|uniref:Rhodopsin domain-containing protein n=1 Tax=Elsinoe australis TaxID=40998 RepID=A0A4U7AZL6_9PEZI|nr:hypothetical protein C1H76_5203 [Elsinoe australis]